MAAIEWKFNGGTANPALAKLQLESKA